MLQAEKVAIERMQTLCCTVPYALEGMVRRSVDAVGAELLEVQHASVVTFKLTLPETAAEAFVFQLNENGQGRIGWLKPD